MKLLTNKKSTYEELKAVVKKANLMGTNNPTADKRFQKFTEFKNG